MQKHFDLFEKWIFKISKEIILLSSKHLLVSSFYRLNTLCMRIAIKIGYFNVIFIFKLFKLLSLFSAYLKKYLFLLVNKRLYEESKKVRR